MKKAFDLTSVSIFILLMLLATAFPARITELTKSGLKMCLNGAIPSIFVLMILSQFLTRVGITEAVGLLLSRIIMPIFGIKKELCGAFLTGIISGFPNGAHSVGLMYNKEKCTKLEAEMCLALSNNCSISFYTAIIGAKVLKSIQLGIIIAVSNLFCIIIESIILRQFNIKPDNQVFSKHDTQVSNKINKISNDICQSITSSCTSAVYITGFITFFYVISHLFSESLKLNSTASFLLTGFFELFSGVMSIDISSIYMRVVLCSIMSGFSGLSVIFQVTEAAQRYGLSVKKFIYTRILNAFLMPPTALLLTKLIHNESHTAFNNYVYYPQSEDFSVLGTAIVYAIAFTAAMIFLFCIYLVSSITKKENSRIIQDKV